MSQAFTIIDVETTGGDPRKDRITEIAIYRYDGNEVIESFVSLINPEMPIPDFITRITGIDNDMVREAPRFYEIARKVVEITEDSIFVAHNARFDYSFIQKEFRRLGYRFSRKQLCTIKYSQKVFPGMRSYSLSKLCKSLEIKGEGWHRAEADVRATLDLFKKLQAEEQLNNEEDLLKIEIAYSKLPPNLPRQIVADLPEETGVYYFRDKNDSILYVGKSNNIRKRILSHFQGAYKARKTIRMIEQIYHISYEVTGSELVALLLENEEIKKYLPPFNRAQRRRKYKFGIYYQEEASGYISLHVDRFQEDSDPIAGHAGRRAAEAALERKGREFELCPKLYGAEKGPGRCFHHQLHLCKGACVEAEPAEAYNARVWKAIESLGYSRGNEQDFLIVGQGRHPLENSVVWVKSGTYQGYTFIETEYMDQPMESIIDMIPFKGEVPDVQRIIKGYIKRNPKEVVHIPYIPDPLS
ncbi:MAG: exonuclease domain-containing protein [Bacteroidia bacterium]